ncbi:MAG: 3-hydroxyacyl-ACP dehydratase FabZ [Proteobacteria bacterium]|nr:3-hydroxyacyl-ACP dehydratase FabZ [Pseudomonadota bacterium]
MTASSLNIQAHKESSENNNSQNVPETIDIIRIREMIPHRYPMLLIDKLVNVIPNESGVGIKNVTLNEWYFQGHFPESPIMPGVLIIEAMAQTAAVLVMRTMGKECEGKLVYFMSVENARFRKPVVPGDTLHLHVIKQRQRSNVWRFEGKALVDNTPVAEAIFTAMLMDS